MENLNPILEMATLEDFIKELKPQKINTIMIWVEHGNILLTAMGKYLMEYKEFGIVEPFTLPLEAGERIMKEAENKIIKMLQKNKIQVRKGIWNYPEKKEEIIVSSPSRFTADMGEYF